MRYDDWRHHATLGLILATLFLAPFEHGQTAPASSSYPPDTPVWVPLIDECTAAGGGRNDCIEALPPHVYADVLAWERSEAAARHALGQFSRTPRVPPPEYLREIYSSPLSVPGLPAEVAQSLVDSGCLIPKALTGHPNVGLLYRHGDWEYYRAISISRRSGRPEDMMLEKSSSNLYCHEGR